LLAWSLLLKRVIVQTNVKSCKQYANIHVAIGVFQLIDRLTRHPSVPILNAAQLQELIAPVDTAFSNRARMVSSIHIRTECWFRVRRKKCESSMLRRKLVLPTLVCYGLIAVFGQGLHVWFEHDGEQAFGGDRDLVACDPFHSTHECLRTGDQHHPGHNEQQCSICQHHSLGQFFVAESPSAIAIVECGFTTVLTHESANCPTHHLPSQPRAPPLA
jgi:hypothetical protein